MIGYLLALAALVIGLMLFFHVTFGTLTPYFIPVAIICLALAILIGPVITRLRGA